MSGEQIVGIVFFLLCTWGCGIVFFVIGLHADRSSKPVNFWAGQELDPHRVTDIAAYNHENAVLWKRYSIPFWLSGAVFALEVVNDAFSIAGIIVLFSACFPGLLLLIRKYKQIEKRYIT